MTIARYLLLAILFGASHFGCSQDDTEQPAGHTDSWEELLREDHGPLDLMPMEEISGKRARRLSVDHLRKSIPNLFGGITWTNPNGRQDQFEKLAQTLGEADYLQVTQENTEPSPLFAKFMDDMAGNVCEKALESDVNEGTTHIVADAEDIDENIRFLRLKLHGIYVPQDSTESLTELRELYDDILSTTGEPNNAWFGVCIAMLTAPEFMAY